MGTLTAVQSLDARLPDGPVHRLIVAVDIEGSTTRNNPAKGELRRALYELIERALEGAGITARHLEPHTDRGDSVLILIRPYDDVPKTLLLGRLIPLLTGLLIEHNAAAARPELRIRMRAVVHAGEIHEDSRGFYGDDLDVAFRLLEAPKLKQALKEAIASPLVLTVSDAIFDAIVQQGYLDASTYRFLGRVRVGNRRRRSWVHVPVPLKPDPPAAARRPKSQLSAAPLALASPPGGIAGHAGDRVAAFSVSGREEPRSEPG
jgi:hypothetical protein